MKKIKLMSLGAVAVLFLGILTGCGDSADGKVAKEAIGIIGSYASKLKQVESQVQLPATIAVDTGEKLEDVTITWAASPKDAWTFLGPDAGIIYATPKLPDKTKDEKEISFTLTATATFNKSTAKKSFKGKLMPTDTTLNTVAETKAKAVGETVSIKGIVGEARSSKGFYIVDATGAIYVFTNGSFTSYVVGQEMIVKGSRTELIRTISSVQIPLPQITYVGSEVVNLVPVTIPTDAAGTTTVQDILDWNKTPTASNFINRTGEIYKIRADIVKVTPGSYSNWRICPPGTTSPYLNLYSVNATSTEYYGYVNDMAQFEGKTCDIVLVVYDINTAGDAWRIVPLSVTLAA